MQKNEPLLPDFLDFEVYPFQEKEWKNWCVGTNEKQTIIFIQSTDDTDELMAFLTKIIAAVKYDLKRDTLLCVLPIDEKLSMQTILKKHPAQKILIFGIEPKTIALHLQLPAYQVIEWNNLQLLQADSLSKINGQNKLKGALWNALQQMFL
ncbi:MAG: hypothetical protein ACPG19_03115 [Saprospiraceae bacterium]